MKVLHPYSLGPVTVMRRSSTEWKMYPLHFGRSHGRVMLHFGPLVTILSYRQQSICDAKLQEILEDQAAGPYEGVGDRE